MSQIHPNYIKASNLVILSAVIGIFSILFSGTGILSFIIKIVVVVMMAIIFGVIAYFIRKGNETVKYVLLVLFLIGIPASIKSITTGLTVHLVRSIISVIQMALQVWVLVILFKIPKRERSYFPERGTGAM